jgi:hypothetical protein
MSLRHHDCPEREDRLELSQAWPPGVPDGGDRHRAGARSEGLETPSLLTLLCLSRTYRRVHRPGELSVEFAGDVSLEAAADLPGGLSLGGAPGDVGAGRGQLRIQTSAMAWMARFRARSPPRLSRCRTVMPLLAGSGLVSCSETRFGAVNWVLLRDQ